MSVMEAPAKPIFGPITVEDMRKNELLIKTVLPLVRDACKLSKGRFTEDKVFDGLIAGSFKLWGVLRPPASLEAIIVTQAKDGVFEILALGPEFEDALAFLPMLTGEARSSKCERMRITGPKFWRREFLPDFDMVACVFEKDLGAR